MSVLLHSAIRNRPHSLHRNSDHIIRFLVLVVVLGELGDGHGNIGNLVVLVNDGLVLRSVGSAPVDGGGGDGSHQAMQLPSPAPPVLPGCVLGLDQVPAVVDGLEMVVLWMLAVVTGKHVTKVVLVGLQ